MSPEALHAWVRVARDAAIIVIASFMLAHETLTEREPNIYIITAALALFGVPAALRLDERRKDKE